MRDYLKADAAVPDVPRRSFGMEDFNALAAALGADLEGVRACLIVSRDGLVMGAYPDDAEDGAKHAWLRVATLGDPERGFFQFATETWCYVRRGAYAAFVVATATVRPGLLIDQMERVLLAADEARADRSVIKPEPATPPPVTAPSGKPRTTLHREPAKADEPIVLESEPVSATAAAGADPVAASAEPTPQRVEGAPPAGADEASRLTAQAPDPSDGAPARPSRQSVWATDGGDDEPDPFAALREFGQLLQDDERGADG